MKIFIATVFAVGLLTGCSDQPKQGFREALVAKLAEDPDLKDYQLSPELIADCVVAEVAENAPGIPGDPRREAYFGAYAKFVAVPESADPRPVIAAAKDIFGSEAAAREAALGVTEHILTCMGKAVEREDAQPHRDATPPPSAPPTH